MCLNSLLAYYHHRTAISIQFAVSNALAAKKAGEIMEMAEEIIGIRKIYSRMWHEIGREEGSTNDSASSWCWRRCIRRLLLILRRLARSCRAWPKLSKASARAHRLLPCIEVTFYAPKRRQLMVFSKSSAGQCGDVEGGSSTCRSNIVGNRAFAATLKLLQGAGHDH